MSFFASFYIKSILFWLYLWQIKEYRLDRFWAEYGNLKLLGRFWFFAGGRYIRFPRWTFKMILMFLLALAINIFIFFLFFSFIDLDNFLASKNPGLIFFWLILFGWLLYLLIPFFVFVIVALFKIPTFFIKRLIIWLAKKKMASLEDLLVIGITGSYGKSSTKELLAQLLSYKFPVIKTPENINSEIGIALFILKNWGFGINFLRKQRLKSQPKDSLKKTIFVVEMGAYRRGEIKNSCAIVNPKIGILTGLNEQHISLFGSLENTKKAKFELIESLSDDGFAVFNGENQYTVQLADKWTGHKVIYRANYEEMRNYPNFRDKPRHYWLNLAGAIEVAKYLGFNEQEIKKAIENIKIFDRMIKSYIGKNRVFVIDDSYSANPEGVLAALDYLDSRPESKKIIIMPCLIELGQTANLIHQRIGRKIKEVVDLAIIITPHYFSDIKKEAGEKAVFAKSSKIIKNLLDGWLDSNTAVLLEGRIPSEIIEIISAAK